MNRLATGFVVAVSLVALTDARAQSASATTSVEEQIKKMEKDRAAAVVKGDVATLEALTADDYVLINVRGQVTDKATTMNNIRSGNIKLSANELSDMKVRVYGDTAVVTGKSSTKGTIGGQEITAPMMFTRVYVKKNGKWQSVLFQQTSIAP